MSPLPQHQSARPTRSKGSSWRRGIIIYLALLLGLSWAAYLVMNRPAGLPTSLDEIQDKSPGHDYGLNARPDFKDMIQLLDLPSKFLPQKGQHKHSGRLVIVGDVHGMKDALVELLAKVNFNEKHDHLILAGDMISKGPDSVGVVDLAMKLRASGVRGNHEDRIILTHADMVTELAGMGQTGPSEDGEKKQDALQEESSSHGDYKDRALVRALGEKRIKWLKECPVILRVGKLPPMGEVVVVHAGLAPGVKLEKQDPLMVMNMRTIGDDGVPSDGREGLGWMKVWNKFQKSLPNDERTTVIYGHDSKRGLQVEKYSMGIDTGCLRGGQLTAVVIEGGHSDHTHKLVHVNCKDGREGK